MYLYRFVCAGFISFLGQENKIYFLNAAVCMCELVITQAFVIRRTSVAPKYRPSA
jgi:hypothetical protein